LPLQFRHNIAITHSPTLQLSCITTVSGIYTLVGIYHFEVWGISNDIEEKYYRFTIWEMHHNVSDNRRDFRRIAKK